MIEAINLGVAGIVALVVCVFSTGRVNAISAQVLLSLACAFFIDGYLSGWQLPAGAEMLNTLLIVGLVAGLVGVLKK